MTLVSCTKNSDQNEIVVKIDFEAAINEIQINFEDVLRDFLMHIPNILPSDHESLFRLIKEF